MIINNNTIEFADNSFTLNNSVIIAIAHSGVMNGTKGAKETVQFRFYESIEKALEDKNNELNVKGISREKRRVTFDYPYTDKDVFLFFDIKIKEYLMSIFPAWSEDKLVLTTEQTEEE